MLPAPRLLELDRERPNRWSQISGYVQTPDRRPTPGATLPGRRTSVAPSSAARLLRRRPTRRRRVAWTCAVRPIVAGARLCACSLRRDGRRASDRRRALWHKRRPARRARVWRFVRWLPAAAALQQAAALP